MSRIIAPQWVNRRRRGKGEIRERARRVTRGARFPDHIAGLQLLIDARSLDLADAASVATWEDLSGEGHDLTQGTAAAQPTYRESGINGRPAVEFDGAGDILTSTAFGTEWSGDPPTPITIAGVFEWQTTGNAGYIASPGNSADDDPLYGLIQDSQSWAVQVRGDSGGAAPVLNGSATDTDPHVAVGRQEQPTIQNVRLDGAADARKITVQGQGPMTFDQFGVGGLFRTSTSLHADIRIGILAAYNTWVEGEDLELLVEFLSQAYGVDIA